MADSDDLGLDLLDHIRLIEGVVEKLTERLSAEMVWKEVGQAGALHIHQEIKILTGVVRDAAMAAEHVLIDSLEGARQVEIDGHRVTQRRAYIRRWDTPLLAGAVAACVLQGERLPEVDAVVEALVEAARMEWRVTELEKLGIADDGYCEKELGRPSVMVS